jgi:hypothetical protein
MKGYARANCPQKLTQPQLRACLILKTHMGYTCRRAEELLILALAVRDAIGLGEGPRLTTLQTFTDRSDLLPLVDGLLRSIGRAINKSETPEAAMDGTGLETTSARTHFLSRAGRKRTKFVKLTLGVLCAAVVPCAPGVGCGPSHDRNHAWSLRAKLRATNHPTWLWGDGVFDGEAWHTANWEDWGMSSDAPATVRSADGRVTRLCRHLCRTLVNEYGCRWMCKSVNSAAGPAPRPGLIRPSGTHREDPAPSMPAPTHRPASPREAYPRPSATPRSGDYHRDSTGSLDCHSLLMCS